MIKVCEEKNELAIEKKKNRVNNITIVLLIAVLAIGFIAYYMRLTYSALWYDETIEYFYSKFMSGEVPGGFGTFSMYERICLTKQPPLYNVLMFFWLKFFDSEVGFRLAGVITTLLGAVGLYFGINRIASDKWAAFGTLLYIFTPSVSYYALECAEYNLMLAAICWTLYFYIRSLQVGTWKSLIGFFLCATMAAYSQYGSAFLLVGMFLVMSITFFKDKKLSEIKKMFILTIVVIIVGVVPLIYFFMYKQVSDSLTIAHIPFFAYGNVFRDFLISVVKQIAWCFTRGAVHDQLSIAILIVAFGAVILTLIALFHKNKLLNNIVSVYLISFILYYFATACNYYGWNSWTSTVGTKNIGGRYSLFFVPLIMILLTYGIFIIITYLKENNIHGYYFLIAIVSLSFVGYSIAGIWILHKNWIKDDVRELTKVWYADNAYNSKTIVHEWDDANFQYYLIHDYQYKENYQNNIQAAGYWIRSANDQKMEDGLQELGAFDYDDFYYVAPKENYNSSYKSFLNVMYNRGYLVTILFEGRSVLLHVTASN